jgi:hypothetical protein
MTDTKIEHPEWDVENSLTAPSDRAPKGSYKPNQGHRALDEEEVDEAMKTLDNNSFVSKFLRVERKYADPVEPLQRIGLLSFVPAKGATPNDKGIYGFAKLRGNYPTDQEASERAEFIIRNVDSYHRIYHTYVGRPFPCTVSPDFSSETTEIDIRKEMTTSVSHSIKTQKDVERKQIEEIEQREKDLLSESKREGDEPPLERYTTLRVKKAQVVWTYLETQKKMDEMKDIIIKTRAEIQELEKNNDEYAKTYFKKYCDARSESGLDNSANQDTFMKFLVEDEELPF